MWISTAASLLLLGGAPAPPLSTAPTVQEEAAADALRQSFLALEDEYQDAYSEWRTANRAASIAYNEQRKTDPKAAFDGPERIEPEFFPRFDRLAQAGVWRAKEWCLSNFVTEAEDAKAEAEFTRRVMELLARPEGPSSALPGILSRHVSRSAYLQPETTKALLRLTETVSSDHAVKSAAAYYLADAPATSGVPEETAKQQRVAAMRALRAGYPDTPMAKRAEGILFVEDNLQIGMVAPDIVGKDVDGNEMKLSDFRGKVTVIDFWGFW